MQAGRGRVEAAVEGDRPVGECLAQRGLVGGLRHQASPSQLVEDVAHGSSLRRAPGGARPDGRVPACPIRTRACERVAGAATPGRYGRDRRLAVQPEPPRVAVAVPAGAADPDPRPGTHSARPRRLRRRSLHRRTLDRGPAQRRAVQRLVDAQRRGQPRRTAGQVTVDRGTPDAGRAPASCPRTTSPARSSTADADPGRTADQVDAPVHAVGEVDVQVRGRPEHHRRARRATRCGRASPGRPGRRTPRPR